MQSNKQSSNLSNSGNATNLDQDNTHSDQGTLGTSFLGSHGTSSGFGALSETSSTMTGSNIGSLGTFKAGTQSGMSHDDNTSAGSLYEQTGMR
jgi:hypothetical protein